MRETLNLSQSAFSKKFKIPKRTIEDWEAGRRTPPIYVLHLLEFAVRVGVEKLNESNLGGFVMKDGAQK